MLQKDKSNPAIAQVSKKGALVSNQAPIKNPFWNQILHSIPLETHCSFKNVIFSLMLILSCLADFQLFTEKTQIGTFLYT